MKKPKKRKGDIIQVTHSVMADVIAKVDKPAKQTKGKRKSSRS